ncbi:type II toxin-antitoxin system prevent-host-death family antitoxin [Staphylococcus epidermidis]|nr:type II toxin-antitoxin system prevent-host-death family antitoxin [Staphylococcus epidermidis]
MLTMNKVKTEAISEMKNRPMNVFEEANRKNEPIYVTKHNQVAGVVLSQYDYENIINKLDDYENELDELRVYTRINNPNAKLIKDEAVRTEEARNIQYEENDGWE